MLTNMNFLNMGEHTTVRLILVSTMLVVLMRILNFILWPAIKKKKKKSRKQSYEHYFELYFSLALDMTVLLGGLL